MSIGTCNWIKFRGYFSCDSWIFLTISRKASVKWLRNVRVGSDCSKCWFSVHLDGNTPPCGMLIFRPNGTTSWHPRVQNCIFAIRPVKRDGTQLTLMRRMHADDFILGLNERIRDTQSKTPQNLWTTQKRERAFEFLNLEYSLHPGNKNK